MGRGTQLGSSLLDYTYNNMVKLPTKKKIAKDPCVGFPKTGAVTKPGDGLRVLVTGGAGFIGISLSHRLLQLGYRVRIFNNFYTGSIRNVPLQSTEIELFVGDILDRVALREATDGADYLYHLAAMSKSSAYRTVYNG